MEGAVPNATRRGASVTWADERTASCPPAAEHNGQVRRRSRSGSVARPAEGRKVAPEELQRHAKAVERAVLEVVSSAKGDFEMQNLKNITKVKEAWARMRRARGELEALRGDDIPEVVEIARESAYVD